MNKLEMAAALLLLWLLLTLEEVRDFLRKLLNRK